MADNLDPDSLQRTQEELDKLRETITGLVPSFILMGAAMREQIAATKGLSGAEKDGKTIVDNWLKSQEAETAVTKAATQTTRQYDEAMANLNKALGNSVASITSFGKAMMTVGGGMSKYSDSVANAGNAVADAGKAFGPLGMAVGLLAKAISKVVGAVFEFNDNMLKGTDAISKMGIIGDITTTKFREMGAQAGYSSQRLGELAGVYKELGSDITALGLTATEGAKSFNKMIEADEGVLEQYSRLGVTQEELNKNQANYIKLQVASGQQITERSKIDGSLRRASIEYTDNLLQLSAITGENVEGLQKQQAINRAELDVGTRLALMQDKEEALRARALESTDKNIKAQLEAEADRIKQERVNTEKLQDIASTMGMSGKEMAGFNSMLATGNFNELSAGFAAGTPGILEFIENVKKGKNTPEELRLFMAQATKNVRTSIGESITQTKDIGENFAYSSGLLKNEAKYRGMSTEQFKKSIEEEKAAIERAKAEGKDAAKDGRAAQQTTERRMQLAGDSLVSVVQGPITKAFEMFQRAMSLVAKYLAKFAVWLGAPDFTDMFETPDEVAEKQQKNASILQDTNTALEKVRLAADDPKKYKEQLSQQKKLADDEVKTKTDLYRNLKKQASEEQDVSKKVILEKKAEAVAIELNEAMTKRNTIAMEESSAIQKSDVRIKKDAQAQLEALERKKIELTQQSNKLEEDRIKRSLETGKITLEEAEKARAELRGAQPAADASGRRTAGSDARLQRAEAEKTAKVDPEMLKALSEAGITDKRAQANIMAQVQAESGGVAKSESLKHTPEQLIKMFPKKFKGIEEAKEIVSQGEEAVGNKIYGGRMGNTADEGFKYRGRGLIQLTGKDNYEKYGKLVGADLVRNPDLANDPEIARKIAVVYFKEKQQTGTDLSSSKAVSKAVGHVDIGNTESAKRELMAEALLDKLNTPATTAVASNKPNTQTTSNTSSGMSGDMPKVTKPSPQPPEGSENGTGFASQSVDLAKIMKFGTGSGSQQNFEELNSTFKNAVIAAAKEYNSVTGNKLTINSAKRDSADQERLWNESLEAGRPGIGPTGMAISKPGSSLHEKGEAVDIQNYRDPDAVAALNKQGLSQKVPGDPVHFQALEGGILDGPKSGYPVEGIMHGREAIIPLNPESIITKLLNTPESQITKEMNNNISTTAPVKEDNTVQIIANLYEMMEEKFDAMIEALEDGNDHTEKLVRFSAI